MASNKQGVAVTISISQRQLDDLTSELTGFKNGVGRVVSGAINKLLPKGRTEVVNSLVSILAVKRSAITHFPLSDADGPGAKKRERISLVKANPTKLEGKITVLTRRIGLINFEVKEKRKKRGRKYGTSLPGEGVTVRVYRGGPQQHFPHSFIAYGAHNNRHIFLRRHAGGKVGTRAGRFPLDRRQGPSLLTVYKNHPEIDTRVQDRLDHELQKELDSQLNRILKRPARKV
jgi:hypothetical protein